MKNTKKLIAVVTTYLLTWLILTLICFAISDLTIKESATHQAVITIQFFLGWIPSAIVVSDIV